MICVRKLCLQCHFSDLWLKLVTAIFYQVFIFKQMIALQKLWKMLCISSKKLFSFSRYFNFCIPSSHFFLPVSHYVKGCFKINLKVYDVINCLNKNLITHFVWYLGKEKRYDIEILSISSVLNKETFNGKSCRKCVPTASPRPVFNFGK